MAEAKKKENESIYLKLARVQSKIGAIHKDAKNPFHKSNYESLEAILSALTPLLSDEGLALFNNVEHSENIGLVLKTTLTNGVDNLEVICPLAADGKNMMQAYGSAISYSRRYNLRNMFNLITTDEDAESAHSKQTLKQVVEKKSGQTVIPEGRNKGKTVSDFGKDEAFKWISECNEMLEIAGKDIPDWFKEFEREAMKEFR